MKWFVTDGNCEIEIEAFTKEEAAHEYMRDFVFSEEDLKKTQWIDILVKENEDDTGDWITVEIEPEEPICFGDKNHLWEEVSVHSNSGGVIVEDICKDCGLKKITNTWDYRRDTGEQGMSSIEYRYPEDGVNE